MAGARAGHSGAGHGGSAARGGGVGRACLAVLGLILVSAFAVVHATHACRGLYAELQELESAQWYLQEDYGRLMLEQSTWASHYRVETVARQELDMLPPEPGHYRVVTP